jgi:BirA family biotin operon repressor/biotin-[acetyl-CoA-carboxylase] ligase
MPLRVERSAGDRFADVRRVASTGSTNTDLVELARAGAPEGVVLVADHQTAGRGRLGRRWQAPAGSSLLVSVLCRPSLPLAGAHLVTVAAGLAAVDAVAEVTGSRPGLKWPNDLVVESGAGTRKLAGLLAESVVEGGSLTAVVVGMGMNVRSVADRPDDLRDTAIAVEDVAGRPVAVDDVLAAWLAALEGRYETLVSVGGDLATARAHRAACVTLGRRVAVQLAAETVEGDAVDLDDDGHLVVEVDGGRRAFAVGDVVHLRAPGA